MPAGRPPKHDREAVMEEVCERLANGELLKDIAASLEINPTQPYKWAEENEEFRKSYGEARIYQAHSLAEDIILIAEGRDGLTEIWKTLIELHADELANVSADRRSEILMRLRSAVIQRDTLRVNTLKWFVSKLAPKIYGDKLDLTSGGLPIPPQAVQVFFVNAPQGFNPQLLHGPNLPPQGQLPSQTIPPDATDPGADNPG